jgi:hypothetical protein
MKLLIVTFPRQASKFFIQALLAASSLIYTEGYFDPAVCDMTHREEIARHWGGNVFREPDTALLNLLDETIMKDSADLIMDRFSAIKMEILRQRLRMIVLYRERKYTFPTSKPLEMLMLFDKFVRATFRPDPEKSSEHNKLMGHLNLLQSFVHHLPVEDENDKCVAIHIVSSFVKFYYARAFCIPIVSYEKLMSLEQDDLTMYLRKQMQVLNGTDFNVYKMVEFICSRRDVEALVDRTPYDTRVQRSLVNYICHELEPELGEMLQES